MNQPIVQLDQDREYFFSLDQGLAVLFGWWSRGGFTPVILFHTNLVQESRSN